MVSLALEPPPSSRPSRSSRRLVSVVLVVVAMAASAAAGFYAGRRTAPRAPAPDAAGTVEPGVAGAGPGGPATRSRASPAGGQPAAVPSAAPGATGAPAEQGAAPGGAPSGPRHLSFALAGPFEEALTAAMPAADRPAAEELTQVVNRLLVWSLRVARDGRRGDRIDLLYEIPAPGASGLPPGGEPVVHAIRYASQKLGTTIAAYRFQPPGAPWPRYYRADGAEVEERLVDAPIDQYDQITSLLRDGRRHKGVDFRTPAGTPVHAPFDAVIERRNWNFAGNGNCLDLRDPASGRHAIFLHLEPLPKDMQPGRAVKKGEQVALSGNSGHSTAPHLHYQLEAPDGRILDPFEVLPIRRVSLEGDTLQAFQSERARLDATLGEPRPPPMAAPIAPGGRARRGR